MNQYTHLSQQERVGIFGGLKCCCSYGELAKRIGRSKSTISRELKRNSDSKGYYYYPPEAQALAEKRKARHGYKVERIPGLKDYIENKLKACCWSPESIAGRWSLEHPEYKISKEAIYAWIYSPAGVAMNLPKLLPHAKPKRGRIRAKKSKSHIPDRVSVNLRPESANNRSELGHLEGDLIFNSGSQSSNLLTVIDRKSRMVILVKHESKKTDPIIQSVVMAAHKLGAKTVTFDNGSEFTNHKKLADEMGVEIFFCRPGAPWEKGSVENKNRQIRRFLPFNKKADTITQDEADKVASILNNTPRKNLGFKTSLEVHNEIDPFANLSESRVKMASTATKAIS
jgi:IS30 family transposase